MCGTSSSSLRMCLCLSLCACTCVRMCVCVCGLGSPCVRGHVLAWGNRTTFGFERACGHLQLRKPGSHVGKGSSLRTSLQALKNTLDVQTKECVFGNIHPYVLDAVCVHGCTAIEDSILYTSWCAQRASVR
jgi:hypothetical protein